LGEENSMLIKRPDSEEIKHVMFNLNANSSSGPDDFDSSFFFHACWNIIDTDVCYCQAALHIQLDFSKNEFKCCFLDF